MCMVQDIYAAGVEVGMSNPHISLAIVNAGCPTTIPGLQ